MQLLTGLDTRSIISRRETESPKGFPYEGLESVATKRTKKAKHPSPVTWAQESLFGHDVLEVTLTVGLVVSGDHCQFRLEARQPVTGELLSMWSIHHAELSLLEELTVECFAALVEALEPFPR